MKIHINAVLNAAERTIPEKAVLTSKNRICNSVVSSIKNIMRIILSTMLFALFSQATIAQDYRNGLLSQIELLHRSVFINKDPDSLQRLLGKNLIYGHTDGHTESRDSLLSRIHPAKGATYSEFEARTAELYFPNKKTAIVRQELDAKVSVNGQASRLQINLLMVWVSRKGKWLLELRQAVKR